jgi:hypothetical protein
VGNVAPSVYVHVADAHSALRLARNAEAMDAFTGRKFLEAVGQQQGDVDADVVAGKTPL